MLDLESMTIADPLTITQLHQLTRILETKRIGFDLGYYVIFGNYPTIDSLSSLLDNMKDFIAYDLDGEYIFKKIVNHRARLSK